MTKIDFGYNDDYELNSSFSRISPYNGEYLDCVRYLDMDLLITRIVDSYKGLNGQIDVREVAQDSYADGSYITYANQNKEIAASKIEELLNNETIKARIEKGENVLEILREKGVSVTRSRLLPITQAPAIVTSVKPEHFTSLKESISKNHRSMYQLVQEVLELRRELEVLKKNTSEKTY